MTPSRWRQIEELYRAVRERGRGALEGADLDLRREVEALLEQRSAAGDSAAGKTTLPDSTLTMVGVGTQLGPYRIEARLGAGGMGEVFRAVDTRLHRTVAIKFSKERFSNRFDREAQAIAQLNHPNICTLYDVGPNYLVMECIEGRTLADLIAGGSLAFQQAIDLVRQAAKGLASAHKRGVLHRDIKPANIMVTPEGHVKIMDFGLAKFREEDAQSMDATALTVPGSVMGTPAYMSPEQASGKPATHQSDIWALGVVLYEMVSGRKPFRGENPLSVLHAILGEQPDPVSALWPEMPSGLDRVIAKALAKDASARYQSVEDMDADLDALALNGRHKTEGSARKWPVYAGLAAAFLSMLGAAGLLRLRKGVGEVRSALTPEQVTAFPDSATNPALSADGRMLTFIRGPDTFTTSGQIYVKSLPNGEPQQLTHDAEAKMHPMFSPDGSRIVYTVRTAGQSWDTWTVPASGGEARPLLPNASGLSYLGPGKVLFSEIKSGIHMAIVTSTASRTEARDIYIPDDVRGMAHRSYLSPDGRSMLLTEMDRSGSLPCRLLPFDGSSKGAPVGPLKGKCTYAAWSPDGKWMYFSSDASGRFQIWRQRYPDGTPEQLTSGPTDAEGMALAPDGHSLITSLGLNQRSVWLHEDGMERQISSEGNAMLPAWGDGFPSSVFSPDGKKLYYLVQKPGQRGFGGGELWVGDLASATNDPLLPGLAMTTYDISPDGRQVVFATIDANGKSRLWLAPVNRRNPPRLLPPEEGYGPVFGGEGKIYFRGPEGRQFYIFELTLDSGVVKKFTAEPAVNAPAISPDRKWIISRVPVNSQETTAVVKAFPANGGAPVLLCEGCFVKWSLDQKTIFFSSAPGNFNGGGRTFVVPLPRGKALPAIPRLGLNSEADFAKLPGVRIAGEVNLLPGPSASMYAFEKQFVQRNLYRIALP